MLVKSRTLFALSATITQNLPRIFAYHRFSNDPDPLKRKIDALSFESQIKQLTKDWNVYSLKDYISRCQRDGRAPSRSVVLTIDDGYCDFYEIAYPILRKYNIPATLFPTVNFVSGKILLWPDKISYALDNARRIDLRIQHGAIVFNLDLSTSHSRLHAWQTLADYCLTIGNQAKFDFIHMLEDSLYLSPPQSQPSEYKAVNWSQLTEMSTNGIEIGSHTMNHPILNRVPLLEAEQEIVLSKRTIEANINEPVITFCYPNGRLVDISIEIVRRVQDAGYVGGVTTESKLDFFDYFMMPRIHTNNDKNNFLWNLSGIEFITPMK